MFLYNETNTGEYLTTVAKCILYLGTYTVCILAGCKRIKSCIYDSVFLKHYRLIDVEQDSMVIFSMI